MVVRVRVGGIKLHDFIYLKVWIQQKMLNVKELDLKIRLDEK